MTNKLSPVDRAVIKTMFLGIVVFVGAWVVFGVIDELSSVTPEDIGNVLGRIANGFNEATEGNGQ